MNNDSKKFFEGLFPQATEEQQAAALNTVINNLSMESTMDDPIEQSFQASYNLLVSQGELTLTGKDNFDVFSIWCANKGYKIYLSSVTNTTVPFGDELVDDINFIIKLVNNPFTTEVKARIENIMKGYQRRHPKEKNFSPKVEDQIDLASILLKAYQTTDSKEASMAFNREWQLYKNRTKEVTAYVHNFSEDPEEDYQTPCNNLEQLYETLLKWQHFRKDKKFHVIFKKDSEYLGGFSINKEEIQ